MSSCAGQRRDFSEEMLGRGMAFLPRSLATTRLALPAQRRPALAQRRRWPLPILATRGLATKGRHEAYVGQMHETTPGMEQPIDVDAAARGYAAGSAAQTAPELHGGRTARDRLVAYAEMRALIEVCSPKLTVGFSQSSYILITYRVLGTKVETAHDIEEMRKELTFLAGTYKLATERLEEVGES